jgi:hypothetical protein
MYILHNYMYLHADKIEIAYIKISRMYCVGFLYCVQNVYLFTLYYFDGVHVVNCYFVTFRSCPCHTAASWVIHEGHHHFIGRGFPSFLELTLYAEFL